MIGNSQTSATGSIIEFANRLPSGHTDPTKKSLISGSLFALLCITANAIVKTPLQNIATSIDHAPFPSTVLKAASDGPRQCPGRAHACHIQYYYGASTCSIEDMQN